MNESHEQFKFITKHALSGTIMWQRVKPSITGKYFYVGAKRLWIHKNYIHDSYLEALQHAFLLRAKKIVSLQKQIQKLNALQFSNPADQVEA